MNWSMPRPVLQLVATLIVAASLGAFAVGVFTADAPARLPGEAAPGKAGVVLEAQEAAPLTLERIEGTPPPPELTEEEKAKLEAERKAKEEAEAQARAEAEAAAVTPVEKGPQVPLLQTPPDAIGEVLEKAPPPPPPKEEPVF